MRKADLIIAVVVCLLGAGCDAFDQTSVDSIEVHLAKKVFESDEPLRATVINFSNHTLYSGGCGYLLQRFESGEWLGAWIGADNSQLGPSCSLYGIELQTGGQWEIGWSTSRIGTVEKYRFLVRGEIGDEEFVTYSESFGINW